MNNFIQRIAKMNFMKLCALSVSTVVLLAGCMHQHGIDNTMTVVETAEVPCAECAPVMPVENLPANNNDKLVNYRETAADYREYGERTPRDQFIVNSGAGSNMSAAIPPTIEEEVTDYEDAVNQAFEEAAEEIEEQTEESSGDDAVEDWLAEEGNTLKGLLSDWCERAGWRLIWNSNRNYTLSAGAMFRGRFADVASALIRNFARAKPAPMATFYRGNRVLVVETREDENAFN